MYQRIAARLSMFAAALTALHGCQVGMHTYPPNLVYLAPQEVQSTMRRLLVDVWTINDILDSNESISGYNRERIIEVLRNMEQQADHLGAGAEVTNHLVIDNNIDEFKYSVRSARRAVEDEPPNYYLAGRLSGNCLACHAKRKGSGQWPPVGGDSDQ